MDSFCLWTFTCVFLVFRFVFILCVQVLLLTSCLCPVSRPCDGLHLFLMCFTCVQLAPPPLCI